MKKIKILITLFSLVAMLGVFVTSCSEEKVFEEELNPNIEAQIETKEISGEVVDALLELDQRVLETANSDWNKLYVLYLGKLELIAKNKNLTSEDVSTFIKQYQNYNFVQLSQELSQSDFFTNEVLTELTSLQEDLVEAQSVERKVLLLTTKIDALEADQNDAILADVLKGYRQVLELELGNVPTERDCLSDCIALNTYSGLYWAYYNSAYCPPLYNMWQCINYRHSYAAAMIKLWCKAQCVPPLPSRRVELYEGNGGTQDLVGVIDISYNRSVRFKNDNCCENDEARSMKIYNMKAGERLAVYDDSDPNNPSSLCGDTKDDWMCLVAKRDFSYKLISTFETVPRVPGTLINDADVIATYGNGGNLDGKVSRFKKKN